MRLRQVPYKRKKKGKHRFQLPDPSTVELVLLTLGPFEEFGEHQMEEFGRAYSIMKYVQNMLSPTKCSSFFAASKTPWTERAIPASEAPSWMSAHSSISHFQLVLPKLGPLKSLDNIRWRSLDGLTRS